MVVFGRRRQQMNERSEALEQRRDPPLELAFLQPQLHLDLVDHVALTCHELADRNGTNKRQGCRIHRRAWRNAWDEFHGRLNDRLRHRTWCADTQERFDR